jgi:hypothetical protein
VAVSHKWHTESDVVTVMQPDKVFKIEHHMQWVMDILLMVRGIRLKRQTVPPAESRFLNRKVHGARCVI